MKTNPNNEWSHVRASLFKQMDARSIQGQGFSTSEHYFFVQRCATIFEDPGSDAAAKALDWISDTGCFRLVVDRIGNLLDLLGVPEEDDGMSTPEGSEPAKSPAEPAERDDVGDHGLEGRSEDQPRTSSEPRDGIQEPVEPEGERRSRVRSRDNEQEERPRRGASFRRR